MMKTKNNIITQIDNILEGASVLKSLVHDEVSFKAKASELLQQARLNKENILTEINNK